MRDNICHVAVEGVSVLRMYTYIYTDSDHIGVACATPYLEEGVAARYAKMAWGEHCLDHRKPQKLSQ